MAEVLRQDTWTEQSLWILLTAILHQSRSINFLIIIYDFENWPSEIRSWWSDTLASFRKSCSLSFAFLTSSHRPINDLTSLPSFVETGYGKWNNDLIKAKTNKFLGCAYAPGYLRNGPQ